LTAKDDNILQKNLFIILTSVEMALSRVYAIFHAAICFPIRYLAGACHHKLDTQDFSFRSMGQVVIDILDGKLNEIVETPSLYRP
jgi:hypothetical protein